MDKEKAIYYIEHSFLASLIENENVTDITFNGVDIYYVSNIEGRRKADINIEHQVVKDFLRQIANLTEQQFSYTNPVLDVSVGKYRINATHQSIGKVADDDVVTFAIRIASISPKIEENGDFITKPIVELVNLILQKRLSIVIGGVTGSGKTEFQKFLLRKMRPNERVIVIDNVMELDMIRSENGIDLTCWKVDEKNIFSSPAILIKNALRNNPDWLILAEARDKEMVDVLNSAMTGAPIITTIHAFDAKSLPFRMARLVLRSDQKLDYDETLKDIYYHFHFYFYLSKVESNNKITRYISEVGFIDDSGRYFRLFHRNNKETFYYPLPTFAYKLLGRPNVSEIFRNTFLKEVKRDE